MDSAIQWGTAQARAVLMIPGPTELPWTVIQAMNQPPTIQYDQRFDLEVLEPATLALRDVFQIPSGEVVVMPGSGRTALEAGAVSVIEPGDRVIVIVAGVFGLLMREIMTRVGAEVTEFPVEWGRPIDLARLEREIERVRPKAVTMVHNETSTGTTYPAEAVGDHRQAAPRALSARHRVLAGRHRRAHRGVGHRPQHDRLAEMPGRAARHVAGRRGPRGVGRDGAAQAQGQLAGLRPPALEGALGARVPRRSGARRPAAAPAGVHPHPSHRRARRVGSPHQGGRARQPVPAPRGGGAAFRAGLEAMRLEIFPESSIASNTVSCFKTPPGVEPAAVVTHMRDRYGILIGTGLDKIRTTTLRVGHMGITANPMYVLPTLSALELTLRDLGHRCEAGAGVAAAQAVFSARTA
jgi:(S)-ureidoglycine-glyoxylate aminotransferase